MDLDVFFNPLDFGEAREFVLSDGMGGTKTINPIVIWDTDLLKERSIVNKDGTFLGDVCVFIRALDLPRIPQPGEVIFSPSGIQWDILQSDKTLGVVELSLQRVRAHAY